MPANKINICLSCDDNYAQHMAVTIASILKNKAPDDILDFCILDGGISQVNKNKIMQLSDIGDFNIEFIQVDNSLFNKCPIQDWTHLSITAYFRLILPAVKTNWDKIIYLDCDIVVKSSLNELFNTDLKNSYLAAVPDISEEKHAARLNICHYCNSGVLIFNAKKWREDNVSEKIFLWIKENENKIVLHDQDILNAVINNNILILDKKWNAQIIRDYDEITYNEWKNANILHFIHKKKPWIRYNGDEFTAEYSNYIKLTPWKKFLFKYYFLIIPISIIENFLRFIFEVKNQRNTNNKIITVLGLKFTKSRG